MYKATVKIFVVCLKYSPFMVYYICVYVYHTDGSSLVMAHLWRSEDKLLDSVLASTMWALEMNLGSRAWQ